VPNSLGVNLETGKEREDRGGEKTLGPKRLTHQSSPKGGTKSSRNQRNPIMERREGAEKKKKEATIHQKKHPTAGRMIKREIRPKKTKKYRVTGE